MTRKQPSAPRGRRVIRQWVITLDGGVIVRSNEYSKRDCIKTFMREYGALTWGYAKDCGYDCVHGEFTYTKPEKRDG